MRQARRLTSSTYVAVARAAIIAEREAAAKRKEAKAEKKTKKQERRTNYQTPEALTASIQDCGAVFDAKEFILDCGDHATQSATGAVEAVCPNQDATPTAPTIAPRCTLQRGRPERQGRRARTPAYRLQPRHLHDDAHTRGAYVDRLCHRQALTVADLLQYAPTMSARPSSATQTCRAASGARADASRADDGQRSHLGGFVPRLQVGPRVHDENGAGWGTEISFKNDSGKEAARRLHWRTIARLPAANCQRRTACARVCADSFKNIFFRCDLIVSGAMPSAIAIALFDSPRAISETMSISRWVSRRC